MTNFKSDVQIFVVSKNDRDTVEYFEGSMQGSGTTSLPVAKFRLAFLTHIDQEEEGDAMSYAHQVFSGLGIDIYDVNIFTDKQSIVDKVTTLLRRADEMANIFEHCKVGAAASKVEKGAKDKPEKGAKDDGKKGKCALL